MVRSYPDMDCAAILRYRQYKELHGHAMQEVQKKYLMKQQNTPLGVLVTLFLHISHLTWLQSIYTSSIFSNLKIKLLQLKYSVHR